MIEHIHKGKGSRNSHRSPPWYWIKKFTFLMESI